MTEFKSRRRKSAPAGWLVAPDMTPGRAAMVALMRAYLNGFLDPTISLLELHKLLYFVQAAGEPLRLRYVQATYGPYAENLRHVLRATEGHLVTGYADGGDAPDKPIQLLDGAEEQAAAFLEAHPETRGRIERVRALVDGFESAFGLELLSTVHWLRTHADPVPKGEALVSAVHGWHPHKRQFSPRQIAIAADRLTALGWCS